MSKKSSSGAVAKERLKLILITDRISCSPQVLQQMKDDIYNVASKYVEISKNDYYISIVNSQLPVIVANIPIKQKYTGEQYV